MVPSRSEHPDVPVQAVPMSGPPNLWWAGTGRGSCLCSFSPGMHIRCMLVCMCDYLCHSCQRSFAAGENAHTLEVPQLCCCACWSSTAPEPSAICGLALHTLRACAASFSHWYVHAVRAVSGQDSLQYHTVTTLGQQMKDDHCPCVRQSLCMCKVDWCMDVTSCCSHPSRWMLTQLQAEEGAMG